MQLWSGPAGIAVPWEMPDDSLAEQFLDSPFAGPGTTGDRLLFALTEFITAHRRYGGLQCRRFRREQLPAAAARVEAARVARGRQLTLDDLAKVNR